MRSQIITILPNTHSRNLKPCESQRHSVIDCVLTKKFCLRNVGKDFVVNFNQLYRLCIDINQRFETGFCGFLRDECSNRAPYMTSHNHQF